MTNRADNTEEFEGVMTAHPTVIKVRNSEATPSFVDTFLTRTKSNKDADKLKRRGSGHSIPRVIVTVCNVRLLHRAGR